MSTTHGSSLDHSKLVNEILLELSKPQYNCRVWKQHTGVATSFSGDVIRYGLNGSADISGILSGGLRLEIECKTGKAHQSKEQLAFQSMINKYGGIYILARSVLEVTQVVQQAAQPEGLTHLQKKKSFANTHLL